MKTPYVGVTGVMTRADAQAVLDLWTDPNRLVMVGVLATSLTLAGKPSTRYPARYPSAALIRGIWPMTKDNDHDPRSLNLVHYATKNRATLKGQLDLLKLMCGPLCDGIQLNMIWPDFDAVHHARTLFDRVVLQLGPSAMKEAGSPSDIADRLAPYKGYLTDVLIDASGGKGVDLDVAKATTLARAVRDKCPDLGVGVAGGLQYKTVPDLKPLLDVFPDLNIDAEGRIRDENDKLDLSKTLSYLSAFQRMTAKP